MTKPITTLDEARQHYVGLVIHGKKIVDVIDGYTDRGGKQGWLLKVICPHCGNEFEKKLVTIRSNPNANCGCMNKPSGAAWRGKAAVEQKKKETPRARSTARWYSEDAVSQFTKDQLFAYWQTLDQEKVCKAWHTFDLFYEWAIRNGYTRDRKLCHVDTSKPMSPLTCKWVEEK